MIAIFIPQVHTGVVGVSLAAPNRGKCAMGNVAVALELRLRLLMVSLHMLRPRTSTSSALLLVLRLLVGRLMRSLRLLVRSHWHRLGHVLEIVPLRCSYRASRRGSGPTASWRTADHHVHVCSRHALLEHTRRSSVRPVGVRCHYGGSLGHRHLYLHCVWWALHERLLKRLLGSALLRHEGLGAVNGH